MISATPELLAAATLEWLESLRVRSTSPGVLSSYGDDLALTITASSLIDGDRSREGVFLQAGELTVDRLEVGDDGFVDLDAEIVFPPDEMDEPSTIAPGRARGEVRLGLGPVYFTGDEADLRLVDYTRESLRMSAVWCTHPEGEDSRGGLAVVPQAVTKELHGGGRVLLEVSSDLDREIILRVGRPDRPRGIFKRQPAVEAPTAGIPLRPGGTTHLAGLTRRSRLTEVEIFAFDAIDRTLVSPLMVQIELPRGHPGEHGEWCG